MRTGLLWFEIRYAQVLGALKGYKLLHGGVYGVLFKSWGYWRCKFFPPPPNYYQKAQRKVSKKLEYT